MRGQWIGRGVIVGVGMSAAGCIADPAPIEDTEDAGADREDAAARPDGAPPAQRPDAGRPPPDAGRPPPDAGRPPPDAGPPPACDPPRAGHWLSFCLVRDPLGPLDPPDPDAEPGLRFEGTVTGLADTPPDGLPCRIVGSDTAPTPAASLYISLDGADGVRWTVGIDLAADRGAPVLPIEPGDQLTVQIVHELGDWGDSRGHLTLLRDDQTLAFLAQGGFSPGQLSAPGLRFPRTEVQCVVEDEICRVYHSALYVEASGEQATLAEPGVPTRVGPFEVTRGDVLRLEDLGACNFSFASETEVAAFRVE